jgi:hypothetical protein
MQGSLNTGLYRLYVPGVEQLPNERATTLIQRVVILRRLYAALNALYHNLLDSFSDYLFFTSNLLVYLVHSPPYTPYAYE